MNIYDSNGKLEGKITEVTDGYQVMFDGIIIGIYDTEQNARVAVMTQKRLKLLRYKRQDRAEERYQAHDKALKNLGVCIIVGFILSVFLCF